jgi:hypothetical protein
MEAAEITDSQGKLHYTGVNSYYHAAARLKGFACRVVHLSGHCIDLTANYFIHYPNPSLLKGGRVRVDGIEPDKSKVATDEEKTLFFKQLNT